MHAASGKFGPSNGTSYMDIVKRNFFLEVRPTVTAAEHEVGIIGHIYGSALITL